MTKKAKILSYMNYLYSFVLANSFLSVFQCIDLVKAWDIIPNLMLMYGNVTYTIYRYAG